MGLWKNLKEHFSLKNFSFKNFLPKKSSKKSSKKANPAKRAKTTRTPFFQLLRTKPSKDARKADMESLSKSTSGVFGTTFADDDGVPGNVYLIYLD